MPRVAILVLASRPPEVSEGDQGPEDQIADAPGDPAIRVQVAGLLADDLVVKCGLLRRVRMLFFMSTLIGVLAVTLCMRDARAELQRSLDGIDRSLLLPAVEIILRNDDGRARGTCR